VTVLRPVPKPRKRPKAKPKGLKRTPMKRKANQVIRDRERMAFVAQQPCVVCRQLGRTQRSRSQADHLRTRGAGGKEVANLWSLCPSHHDERHRIGLKSFAYRYKVEPQKWAAYYEARFVNRQVFTTMGSFNGTASNASWMPDESLTYDTGRAP
jgi:hypothetical protein